MTSEAAFEARGKAFTELEGIVASLVRARGGPGLFVSCRPQHSLTTLLLRH